MTGIASSKDAVNLFAVLRVPDSPVVRLVSYAKCSGSRRLPPCLRCISLHFDAQRCGKVLRCGYRCPSICGEDCPDPRLCHKCGKTQRLQVVDMKSFTTYEDHNVDEDPVIFLPCGHFFAASTLDGCTSIQTVYDSNDSGEFTGLKSLRGIASEKPKQCPECRAAIHSVRRYGRLLRLVEIRSLERKHLMVVDGVLENLEPLVESNHLGALQKLIKVEKTIRRSPMRIIFEACGGV